MKKQTYLYSFLLATVSAICISFLSGEDPHKKLSVPGYRPESRLTQAFMSRLSTAKIAVLTTVIRTKEGTVYSEASQKAVVDSMRENKLGVPELRKVNVDVGERKGKFQYAMFENDLERIGEAVKQQSNADYFLVVEHLVTPTPSGGIAIGGVHCYVLDSRGQNAFSFLLNSHHKLFVDAKLRSGDASEQGRESLVMKGTRAALTALQQQIDAAR